MRIHPGGFRVVLAGPKVARMLPFLEARGFVGEAFAKGGDALNRLRQAPCHLLLLELECGDLMGIDLARGVKQEGIAGATLLVDDPMKSGMIISALARGVDNFVATPPDEVIFFARIEGMLLAQWGLVVHQQQGAMVEELTRVRQQLADVEVKDTSTGKAHRAMIADLTQQLGAEKKRVVDLVKETKVLREQLTTMHLVTGSKTGLSDEGQAARSAEDGDEAVDFLLDDGPASKSASAQASKSPAPAKSTPPATRATPASTKPAPSPATPASSSKPAPSVTIDDVDLGDDDPFDESTRAMPADFAAALLAQPAASAPVRKSILAVTVPSMAAFNPSHAQLDDFSPAPPTAVDDHGDAHTMAMSADVAARLMKAASKSAPLTSVDFNDQLDDGLNSLADFDELDTMPTDGKGFSSPVPTKQPRASNPAAFDFDNEKTPAAGIGRAPNVPSAAAFKSNDDSTAPGGIDLSTFDQPRAKQAPNKTSPTLDSQIMRDLAGMPSADAEEVLFADDD